MVSLMGEIYTHYIRHAEDIEYHDIMLLMDLDRERIQQNDLITQHYRFVEQLMQESISELMSHYGYMLYTCHHEYVDRLFISTLNNVKRSWCAFINNVSSSYLGSMCVMHLSQQSLNESLDESLSLDDTTYSLEHVMSHGLKERDIFRMLSDTIDMRVRVTTTDKFVCDIPNKSGDGYVCVYLHRQHGDQARMLTTVRNRLCSGLRNAGWIE